jgi:hypothetical protein
MILSYIQLIRNEQAVIITQCVLCVQTFAFMFVSEFWDLTFCPNSEIKHVTAKQKYHTLFFQAYINFNA